MMRIDAHQHFWRLADRVGAWPPPELAALHRDFGPEHLAPLLQEHGVAGTILVQSLPSEDDTRILLGLAASHGWIKGVVGWVDLKRQDAAARIAALAASPKLVGLRPMLQDLERDDWINDEALAPAVEAMLAHRLAFDALVLPRHLPALHACASRHPQLPLVIDHAAKPPIAGGDAGPWRTWMRRMAALPQVHCKLSGLVTEAAPGWRVADLQSYADFILDIFGPRRVIWGSDWPVLNLATDYAGWIAASEALLAGLAETEQQQVLGLNARRFYHIE